MNIIHGSLKEHSTGLVGAYHKRPDHAVVELKADEVDAALAAQDGWVWLHVDLVDQRSQGWLSERCALPASARAILEGHDDSLVLSHEAGTIHGVIADMHQDMERMSTTIGRLHFAVTGGLLVTGRRHPLEAVDRVRHSFASGFCPATAYELFEAVVTAFCKNTAIRLNEASKMLDTVEDRLVTERLNDERRDLKEVRRLAVSLHRPVAGMVALFEEEDRLDWTLPEMGHAVLKRLSMRLERLDREIVMVNDRARLLQEEIAAELADDSNRSLKVMAVMSALLLPGTLIAGIFGMNTAGLPFTGDGSGFGWAIVLGVGATALFYWLLRKAGISLRL
ncbi:transporter [Ochrobactrum soli]|uniref:Transporter n=1 Tax=Ochrobactrum soli TaxID=2448455 RepID=A0A849KT72_9HYPH|nr:transporter [[Ochrobactrum] soli]NNU60594.1 transporter [[Ochrobactrum] soli]